MTKEEAIRKHRAMWNWIAERIEQSQHVVNICQMKCRYIWEEEHDDEIKNECYCCEYAYLSKLKENNSTNHMCEFCPLVWDLEAYGINRFPCEACDVVEDRKVVEGLWWRCKNLYDYAYNNPWKEQAKLSRQIANLPERENV